jgi:hypothetical protein
MTEAAKSLLYPTELVELIGEVVLLPLAVTINPCVRYCVLGWLSILGGLESI